MCPVTVPFPPLEPHTTFFLPVGEGHALYVEECGSPSGLPVVFLHGGPGGGCNPGHRRQFDPTKWRILLLDQRGCGRSRWPGQAAGLGTPDDLAGRLHANTTAHLVTDLETLRSHLGIEKWVVNGNSWGSLLGLAYAVSHPAKILGLQLGAILLGTQREKQWFTHPGNLAARYPAAYAALLGLLPPATPPENLADAAFAAMTNPADPSHAAKVVRAWSFYECLAMEPTPDLPALEALLANPAWLLPHSLLECHFLRHRWFLAENELLTATAARQTELEKIPTVLLQAVQDAVCPPAAALALAETMPHATLHLLPTGGHRADAAMDTARRTALAHLHQRLTA